MFSKMIRLLQENVIGTAIEGLSRKLGFPRLACILRMLVISNKIMQYLPRKQAYAKYQEYQECFYPEYVF
jgi:hypothetical protein